MLSIGCIVIFLCTKHDWKNLLSKKPSAKDYYENPRERLRRRARGKYRNLSEEERNKKRDYRRKRYHISIKIKPRGISCSFTLF